jgi:hypothetical protein
LDLGQNFNSNQALAFCVYSGKGVADLRTFLTALFDHLTEMDGTDDTEYEEEDDAFGAAEESQDQDDGEEEDGDGDGDETFEGHPVRDADEDLRPFNAHHSQAPPSHEFVFRRERPMRSATIPPSGYAQSASSSSTARPTPDAGTSSHHHHQGHSSSSRRSRQNHSERSISELLPIVESSSGSSQNHVSGSRPSLNEASSSTSRSQPSISMASLEPVRTVTQGESQSLPASGEGSPSGHRMTRSRGHSLQDDRGRPTKRSSFRETLNAAEHYASSLLFGRSRSRVEESSGSSRTAQQGDVFTEH